MISTLKFPGCNLSIWSHTVRCCQQLFAPLSLGLLSPIFHDRNEWITIRQFFLDVKRTKTKSPAKKIGKLCECVVNDTELRHRKKKPRDVRIVPSLTKAKATTKAMPCHQLLQKATQFERLGSSCEIFHEEICDVFIVFLISVLLERVREKNTFYLKTLKATKKRGVKKPEVDAEVVKNAFTAKLATYSKWFLFWFLASFSTYY